MNSWIGYVLFVAATAQELEKPADPIVETTGPVAAAREEGQGQATIITSDSFQLNASENQGTFTGNVRVVDPNFELTSDELVIFFGAGNQLERILARGNVVIKQGGRASSSRQAEYFLAEKKITLTGDPTVTEGRNQITGTKITIYQDREKMDVEGRSRVQFFP
ncbi:MAG: LptA/OstA family protein [Verrucomicrobiia bacterium]